MGELTDLFQEVGTGNQAALNRLLELMYQDLHHAAHVRLSKTQRVIALDTTDLVHESYLRFVKAGRLDVSSRAHFRSYAARVMRSVVVDLVRQRRAERHGGNAVHVTLDTSVDQKATLSEEAILRVDAALTDLSTSDPRLVQVVELRYFAGMSDEEVALFLGVAERTVRRDWQKARLLLRAALEQ